jgi:hypothetical protein
MLARMSGDEEPRVRELRPTDPQQLGRYRIVGRLGEGGMGSVFLADAADGRRVALKVIRGELAHDAEFRRRFRGEVARAKQVPPFCTAEVLDADTEHDPPYLVVEYVDGPSLAQVVEERGPLTPANQHGLAVGMAVALTAIHGAGVIHRDLKPSNVLLAPGSPKVIDFGIARAADGADAQTRTDQVVGTVAYISPERFGPNANTALTPAADIFAWGAVVTYAATGRTPFTADVPAAMAVRIMTQPPNLEGLHAPLRELVERALAKDPADRPTARELVDSLLTGAPVPARPAAFPQQPEVLAAAGISPTLIAPTLPAPPVQPSPPRPAPPRAVVGVPFQPPARKRRGRLLLGIGLAVVLLAGGVGGVVWGQLTLNQNPGGDGTPGASATGPGQTGSAAAAVELFAASDVVLVQEELTAPGNWQTRDDAQGATCHLDGGLAVTLTNGGLGSYRCPGPTKSLTDFGALVKVHLSNPDSCAAIWFRYSNAAGGYVLRVCGEKFILARHTSSQLTTVAELFQSATPSPVDATIRVGIKAVGNTFWFFREGVVSQPVTDSQFTAGRVVLGIFPRAATGPPYAATFTNVDIREPVRAG